VSTQQEARIKLCRGARDPVVAGREYSRVF
jgi:hypothetical protein